MKLKQYRCHRCGNIFETERIYKKNYGKKICDKCLKPKYSHKNKKWIGPHERLGIKKW